MFIDIRLNTEVIGVADIVPEAHFQKLVRTLVIYSHLRMLSLECFLLLIVRCLQDVSLFFIELIFKVNLICVEWFLREHFVQIWTDSRVR